MVWLLMSMTVYLSHKNLMIQEQNQAELLTCTTRCGGPWTGSSWPANLSHNSLTAHEQNQTDFLCRNSLTAHEQNQTDFLCRNSLMAHEQNQTDPLCRNSLMAHEQNQTDLLTWATRICWPMSRINLNCWVLRFGHLVVLTTAYLSHRVRGSRNLIKLNCLTEPQKVWWPMMNRVKLKLPNWATRVPWAMNGIKLDHSESEKLTWTTWVWWHVVLSTPRAR